jgi:hypothetical protein
VSGSDLKAYLLAGMNAQRDALDPRCPYLWSSNAWKAWQCGAALQRGIAPAFAGGAIGRVSNGRGDRLNVVGKKNGRGFKLKLEIEDIGGAIHVYVRSVLDERGRDELGLRAKSPKRSSAAQADAAHLPLFIAANEPRLI